MGSRLGTNSVLISNMCTEVRIRCNGSMLPRTPKKIYNTELLTAEALVNFYLIVSSSVFTNSLVGNLAICPCA